MQTSLLVNCRNNWWSACSARPTFRCRTLVIVRFRRECVNSRIKIRSFEFFIRFFNLVRVLLRHRSLMIKWSVVNQLLPLSRNRAGDDYTDVLWLLVLSVKNDSYTIFHLWRFYTLWLFLCCLFTRTGLREENLYPCDFWFDIETTKHIGTPCNLKVIHVKTRDYGTVGTVVENA